MIRSMATSDGHARRRLPLRTASLIALLITLAATAAAVWGAHAVVSNQEDRVLEERASEVALVLTSSIDAIPQSLKAQGSILNVTGGTRSGYVAAAQAAVKDGPGDLTFAWLRPSRHGSGYEVLAAAGSGLRQGDVVDDVRAETFDAAMEQAEMVATPVVGPDRRL